MQPKARAGRTVVLRLRFGDYTKARALAHPRAGRPTTRGRSRGAARELLDARCRSSSAAGITLIGLTVTNLDHAIGPEQLPLFVDDAPVAA